MAVQLLLYRELVPKFVPVLVRLDPFICEGGFNFVFDIGQDLFNVCL